LSFSVLPGIHDFLPSRPSIKGSDLPAKLLALADEVIEQALETLLRIRFLAASTIDMHESSFILQSATPHLNEFHSQRGPVRLCNHPERIRCAFPVQ
jgi:hypothetical protein